MKSMSNIKHILVRAPARLRGCKWLARVDAAAGGMVGLMPIGSGYWLCSIAMLASLTFQGAQHTILPQRNKGQKAAKPV